jgi:hypothetical protein
MIYERSDTVLQDCRLHVVIVDVGLTPHRT